MANPEYLEILKRGVDAWNSWRKDNPDIWIHLDWGKFRGANLSGGNFAGAHLGWTDLSGADLSKANLSGAFLSGTDLSGADLSKTNLRRANLSGANFEKTNLVRADLSGANLSKANLSGAFLSGADLSGADLSKANLSGANLREAILIGAKLNRADLSGANLSGGNLRWTDLSGADLSGVDLSGAILIETNFTHANISGCRIFGVSAWKLNVENSIQKNLIITEEAEPEITVDNLEIAQFVYLLIHNEKIRDVISTIGRKGVLILGRFNIPERKEILNAMREQLRQRGFLPIVFDFDKAVERDWTETIKILAGLSLFVIVDITNPRSSPLELQATVPDYMIPFVPIIQKDEEPFSMFVDLQNKYQWVMSVREYNSKDHLIEKFDSAIIKPAQAKHEQLIIEKNAEVRIQNMDEF